MRRYQQKVVAAFRAVVLITAAVVAVLLSWSVEAASDSRTVTEGISIEGSVSNSTINNGQPARPGRAGGNGEDVRRSNDRYDGG
jgi:hypothetical protein